MAITHTRRLQVYQNFGKFYTWQFTPLLERTGLSMREMNVLLFLANNPQYDTARDVTEFRGLSKSQVSQAVELLVAEGLVSRTPDSSDRRVVHLSLTEEAGPLAREAQALQNSCAARLLSGFGPKESDQLLTFLERVLENGSILAEEAGQIWGAGVSASCCFPWRCLPSLRRSSICFTTWWTGFTSDTCSRWRRWESWH